VCLVEAGTMDRIKLVMLSSNSLTVFMRLSRAQCTSTYVFWIQWVGTVGVMSVGCICMPKRATRGDGMWGLIQGTLQGGVVSCVRSVIAVLVLDQCSDCWVRSHVLVVGC